MRDDFAFKCAQVHLANSHRRSHGGFPNQRDVLPSCPLRVRKWRFTPSSSERATSSPSLPPKASKTRINDSTGSVHGFYQQGLIAFNVSAQQREGAWIVVHQQNQGLCICIAVIDITRSYR